MGKRVLVEMMAFEPKSAGGIFLRDRVHVVGKPREGIVVAVGKVKAGAFPLQVGYRVVVAKHGGVEVLEGEKRYQLFEQKDILGVVMEGEAL